MPQNFFCRTLSKALVIGSFQTSVLYYPKLQIAQVAICYIKSGRLIEYVPHFGGSQTNWLFTSVGNEINWWVGLWFLILMIFPEMLLT